MDHFMLDENCECFETNCECFETNCKNLNEIIILDNYLLCMLTLGVGFLLYNYINIESKLKKCEVELLNFKYDLEKDDSEESDNNSYNESGSEDESEDESEDVSEDESEDESEDVSEEESKDVCEDKSKVKSKKRKSSKRKNSNDVDNITTKEAEECKKSTGWFF